MRYALYASNTSGAVVCFYGHTIKSCINQFDNDYCRKGFKIEIRDNTGSIKIIKKTYK